MVGFARLGDAAPQSSQLRGGNEAVALGAELVNDPQGGGNRAVRHIMQQDHVPIGHIFQHGRLHCGGVVACPVPGVHRPVQDGQPPGLGDLPHPIAAAASGRAEEADVHALQQRLGIDQLLGDLPAAELLHVAVAVSVVADLMALALDALGLLGILLDAVAAQQEGSVGIPLLQAVQQPVGIPAGGAVVKGQGHIFGIVLRLRREHQQKHAAKQHGNSPHSAHILSLFFLICLTDRDKSVKIMSGKL